ncbi:MAG: hypothetical protein ACREA9_19775 [Pyrinomonadaceae bacterium]
MSKAAPHVDYVRHAKVPQPRKEEAIEEKGGSQNAIYPKFTFRLEWGDTVKTEM